VNEEAEIPSQLHIEIYVNEIWAVFGYNGAVSAEVRVSEVRFITQK